jgi:ABC-type polysaccharide/polyol phosphate transport system ATPase subunit
MTTAVLKRRAEDVAICVDHVVKDYTIYRNPRERLTSLIWPGQSRSRTFRALDGISFEVPRGETMGIIGRNGAGKSTLLQVLCGTVSPTEGSVRVNGRFAALLELGAGFNPDFSGCENVYLNASLLGLSREEVDARLGDIRSFADIGDFFDRPVKTYSSGMYVRLAFSVAIHTEPDVLVIDEALSVGDIRFQMKCLARIELLRARGATILFVSHSLEQVKRFCQSAIWMEGGRVKLFGEASFVADRFRDHEVASASAEAAMATDPVTAKRSPQAGCVPAVIETVSISADHAAPFDPLTIDISYAIHDEALAGFLVGVAIKGLDGLHIFGPNTYLERVAVPFERGSHRISYHIPSLPLLSGTYRIDVGLFTDKGLVCLDYLSDVARVTVASPYFSEGLVYITHEWRVHEP